MEFVLDNKGVYCDKNTKIITNFFGYGDKLILETFFSSYRDTDRLNIPIYFMENIYCVSQDKRIDKYKDPDIIKELVSKSVCRQLNENRKGFIKRSRNDKIEVGFHLVSEETDMEFYNEIVELTKQCLLELGYTDINFSKNEEVGIEDLMFMVPFDKQLKVYDLQRDDYLDWDAYFMSIAKLTAQRSKDPSTQVGACIVGHDNVVISLGYNGAPDGWADSFFPWGRGGEALESKYLHVVHAERNAILHSEGRNLKGAKIYVDLFPCNECAKEIAQKGIKEVIYLSDKYSHTDEVMASKRIFDNCGINYRQLCPNKDEVVLKLSV